MGVKEVVTDQKQGVKIVKGCVSPVQLNLTYPHLNYPALRLAVFQLTHTRILINA